MSSFVEFNRRKFLKLLLWFSALYLTRSKSEGAPNLLNSITDNTYSVGKKVLRVQSSGVISDMPVTDPYLNSIMAEKLDRMLEEGIKQFTGQKDLRKSWLSILTGYRRGDRVSIKPNFNFLNHGYRFTITSPQLINSVVKQLVEVVAVKPEDIFIYDLCKKIPSDIVRSRIDFPVNYVEKMDSKSIFGKIKMRLQYGLASADPYAEISMREDIKDSKGRHLKCYIPKVVTHAQHIINMPLLTNHIFISNSGALKNHYGTVRFSNYDSYPSALHDRVITKSIADINLNPHIKNKTKIIIGDGLFGVFDRGEGEGKKKWKTLNNDFPKSIFISKDPVAMDSVMASIVIKERKAHKFDTLSTGYLKEAMNSGLGRHELSDSEEGFKKIEYSVYSSADMA